MTLHDLAQQKELTLLQPVYRDRPVTAGYTSDLLSDVMAHAPEGAALITVQAHRNTVAVAVLADLAAVILCHGREAPEDMLEAARQEGLPLFRTPLDQFAMSVLLAAWMRRP